MRKISAGWLNLSLVLVVFLSSAESLGAQGNVPDTRQPTIPAAPPGGQVPKPANPDAKKGSWTVAGTQRTITEGEFYLQHVLLSKLEATSQTGVPAPRVWEYLLTNSESDAYGIAVTDEELDESLQKSDPDLYGGLLSRWKNLGINERDAREYHRQLRRADRLRDLNLNLMRLPTAESFDVFKQGRQKLRLEYVRFAASDHHAEFPRDQIDETTLKTYWNENRMVQQQFRTQNTVSAELVSIDISEVSAERVGAQPVSREAALAYFQKNKDSLMRQIPPDKQHLLHLDENSDLTQVVSPFQLLEETIKKSIIFEEVLKSIHKQATDNPAIDLEKLARDNGFNYQKVEGMDKGQSIAGLQKFGFNAFNTLFAANEKEVSPRILEEQTLRWFFRLNSRTTSRLPEYEEIRDRLLENYVETKSLDKARKLAQESMNWMNTRLNDAVKGLQEELTRKANEEAERRIGELGLVKEEDKTRERNRALSTIRQPLEDARRKERPGLFDTFIRENNLKLLSTDYFEFRPQRADRGQVSDVEQSRLLFLQTNYYVQSLQAGDITPIVLEDPVTRTFFIARLAEKKDPDIAGMNAVDLAQARSQLKQRKETMFLMRWRYSELARRFQLQTTN